MTTTRKVLVSMAERKEIAENMSKEWGTNVLYRVIDLDKVVKKIKADREAKNLSPYIEIKPVSADQHKMPMRLNTFQKDPQTGVYYGILASVDQHGNPKWQKIQLNDNLTLNMDNINDAKVWAVLRFHPDIKYSPFQNDNPYYEVYDPVDHAVAETAKVHKMKKAFEIVDKLIEEPLEMVFFARYMGADLQEQSNFEIVQGALLMAAQSNPAEFVRKYQDRSRKHEEIFTTGEALAIITEHPESGYMYGRLPLGLTREEAIEVLKKDGNVMTSILTEIEKKDTVRKTVERTMPKKQSVSRTAKNDKLPATGSGDDAKGKEKNDNEFE